TLTTFFAGLCDFRYPAICIMPTKRHLSYLLAACAVIALSGCRVETKSEELPEAEGSGKKAINIRLEAMSKDEIKNAASKAIDKTADLATKARDAATSAVQNAERLGDAVSTISETLQDLRGAL